MGIISKIKDYVKLTANERVNKMYIENPELFIKKLEDDKANALGHIKGTAARLNLAKEKWEDEVSKIEPRLQQLDARIKDEVENGNEHAANSLAETWRAQSRIHKLYKDGIAKVEKNYTELLKKYGDISLQYDSKIQTVRSTLCSYSLNKEILNASCFLNGVNANGVDIPDVEDLIRSLNDENLKVESELKVMADFSVADAITAPTSDCSALNEWKNKH